VSARSKPPFDARRLKPGSDFVSILHPAVRPLLIEIRSLRHTLHSKPVDESRKPSTQQSREYDEQPAICHRSSAMTGPTVRIRRDHPRCPRRQRRPNPPRVAGHVFGAGRSTSELGRPSHRRIARSTIANWEFPRVPRCRISLACGMVTRFWASNTPAFRKGTGTVASNRDWRGLVVCGMIGISARSVSPAGTLTTTAGRTLAAMPRSTSQTSPRRATVIQSTRADRARRRVGRRPRGDPRPVAGHAATTLHGGQAPPGLRSVPAPEVHRIPRSVFSPPGSCHQRPTMRRSGQGVGRCQTRRSTKSGHSIFGRNRYPVSQSARGVFRRAAKRRARSNTTIIGTAVSDGTPASVASQITAAATVIVETTTTMLTTRGFPFIQQTRPFKLPTSRRFPRRSRRDR